MTWWLKAPTPQSWVQIPCKKQASHKYLSLQLWGMWGHLPASVHPGNTSPSQQEAVHVHKHALSHWTIHTQCSQQSEALSLWDLSSCGWFPSVLFFFLRMSFNCNISFFPFFLQTLQYTPSLLFFKFTSSFFIHSYYLHRCICKYVYIHTFLTITCSVRILLFVCVFSGWAFGTGQSTGVLFPGEEPLSHSQRYCPL